MSADARELLLDAALRVYARAGMRGATTRRIADEAGVNEVTLFRQFGSKEALIDEALTRGADPGVVGALPARPEDPGRELREFCRLTYEALVSARGLIRTCMSESAEHPHVKRVACQGPALIAAELEAYLGRVRSAGLASGDWSPRAAAAMLTGTLFADAMGREFMPDHYTHSVRDAIRQYVDLFLHAIGAVASSRPRASTRVATERR